MHKIDFTKAGWQQLASQEIVNVIAIPEGTEKRCTIYISGEIIFKNLPENDQRVIMAKKIQADLLRHLDSVAEQARQSVVPPAYHLEK